MTTKKTKIDQPVYTKSPDGTLEFELIVTKESLSDAYQEALKESVANLVLPGFRKGKVPLALAEKQLDKNQLYTHALEHAFPHAYADFVKKHDLKPLIDPTVTPKSMDLGADWVMKVKTATFPELKLGKYESKVKAIKEFKDEKNKLPEIFDALLEEIKFEVSPFLVDAETKAALQRLAKQLGTLKLSVEDYAKSIQKSLEDLVKDYQATATTNLKLEFILYEIGQAQGFKPEERAKTLDFLKEL